MTFVLIMSIVMIHYFCTKVKQASF